MADLLTEREAAARLKIHPKTLAKLRRSGEGPPHLYVGDRVRYRAEQLETWIAYSAPEPAP